MSYTTLFVAAWWVVCLTIVVWSVSFAFGMWWLAKRGDKRIAAERAAWEARQRAILAGDSAGDSASGDSVAGGAASASGGGGSAGRVVSDKAGR